MTALRHWITQVGIWLTQTGNVWLLFGYADESVSSRCWRLQAHSGWSQLRALVDWVALHAFGQRDHCFKAYIAEVTRRQLPPVLRQPGASPSKKGPQ